MEREPMDQVLKPSLQTSSEMDSALDTGNMNSVSSYQLSMHDMDNDMDINCSNVDCNENTHTCNAGRSFSNYSHTCTEEFIPKKCLQVPLVDICHRKKCLELPLHDIYEEAASTRYCPLKFYSFVTMLHGYNQSKKDQLLQIIKHGVRIPSTKEADDENIVMYNHSSALEHSNFVMEKLETEIKMNRVAGPYDIKPPGLILSPLAVVPKKLPNTFRLIHNLSFPYLNSVNSHTDRSHCQVVYETLDDCLSIIANIGKGCLCSKCDIENAFRILCVDKRDFKYLGFTWNDKFFIDKNLPMGSSVSCKSFEELSCAVQWIMKNKFNVESMSHILDDFMFFSEGNSNKCNIYLKTFLYVAKYLGLPIKDSKTVFPTTNIELYGLNVDTMSMTVSLPVDKLHKARILIDELCQSKKVTVGQIQSIHGFLNFCCRIVPAGRAFLRRLISLTKGQKQQWHKVRVTNGVRQDMMVWKMFLNDFNGKAIISKEIWCEENAIHVHSDACKWGFAGVMQNSWFVGIFPNSWSDYNIAIKEMVPVYIALHLWLDLLSNKTVIFHIDNISVVYNLDNLSSELEEIMEMLRPFLLTCLQHRVNFVSSHICGKLNRTADYLSRFQIYKAFRESPNLEKNPVQILIGLLPWKKQLLN